MWQPFLVLVALILGNRFINARFIIYITEVIRVSAIDDDDTFPNTKVTFRIDDPEMRELFHIDTYTGVITTKKEFNREDGEVYALTVIAEDGAASSLLGNGLPNETPKKFRIVINKKN